MSTRKTNGERARVETTKSEEDKMSKAKAKKDRIKIVGNGNQAPYGIGEIIDTYADTRAGLVKAMRAAVYWYNPATIILPSGNRIDIDYDIVRDSDLSYIDNR